MFIWQINLVLDWEGEKNLIYFEDNRSLFGG